MGLDAFPQKETNRMTIKKLKKEENNPSKTFTIFHALFEAMKTKERQCKKP